MSLYSAHQSCEDAFKFQASKNTLKHFTRTPEDISDQVFDDLPRLVCSFYGDPYRSPRQAGLLPPPNRPGSARNKAYLGTSLCGFMDGWAIGYRLTCM